MQKTGYVLFAVAFPRGEGVLQEYRIYSGSWHDQWVCEVFEEFVDPGLTCDAMYAVVKLCCVEPALILWVFILEGQRTLLVAIKLNRKQGGAGSGQVLSWGRQACTDYLHKHIWYFQDVFLFSPMQSRYVNYKGCSFMSDSTKTFRNISWLHLL